MDKRDFSLWEHLSRMIHLGRHMERVEEVRLAFADKNSYQRIMSEMRMELARMKAWKSKQEVIDENWEELRRGG